jgi:hypothetical protein
MNALRAPARSARPIDLKKALASWFAIDVTE